MEQLPLCQNMILTTSSFFARDSTLFYQLYFLFIERIVMNSTSNLFKEGHNIDFNSYLRYLILTKLFFDSTVDSFRI
jgi:hypothetical protein